MLRLIRRNTIIPSPRRLEIIRPGRARIKRRTIITVLTARFWLPRRKDQISRRRTIPLTILNLTETPPCHNPFPVLTLSINTLHRQPHRNPIPVHHQMDLMTATNTPIVPGRHRRKFHPMPHPNPRLRNPTGRVRTGATTRGGIKMLSGRWAKACSAAGVAFCFHIFSAAGKVSAWESPVGNMNKCSSALAARPAARLCLYLRPVRGRPPRPRRMA